MLRFSTKVPRVRRARVAVAPAALVAMAALVACRDDTVEMKDPSPDAGAGAVALSAKPDAMAALTGSPTATPTPMPSSATTSTLAAIRGVQPGYVDMAGWFAAHQVDRAQLVAFLASKGGSKIEGTRCQAVNVGAPPEPALVCLDQRIDKVKEQVRDHVQFLVVRNAAPAIVGGLFVGYGSWTDNATRFVDLAITVAPDGTSFTLADRGPPGARIPVAASGSLEPKTAEIFGCDQARDKAVGADPEIGKGVAKLCLERGVWPWKNNHFFRPSKAPN